LYPFLQIHRGDPPVLWSNNLMPRKLAFWPKNTVSDQWSFLKDL
jgi:hypothetical protein